MKILDPNQSYTFSKFYRLEQLSDRITEILPNVSLSSETARREILISPVNIEAHHSQFLNRHSCSLKICYLCDNS